MLIVDRWTWVPRELLTDEDSLRLHLTVPNGSTQNGYFACFADAPGYLGIPRALDPTPWLRRRVPAIVATPRRGVVLGTRSPSLGPNEFTQYDQAPAWAALSRDASWPWGRQLVLKCGGGKTVLALLYAQLRQTRTLVVVHNSAMMYQWAKSAQALLGMHRSDIGLLGDKNRPAGHEPLVVALMHMVALRPVESVFADSFGLVIYDEGDLFGATKLSDALPRFVGERLLVTATPERRDGNDELYRLHIGPECFRDLGVDLKPRVTFLRTGMRRRGPVHGHWNMSLINAIARNPERAALVRRVLERLLQRGRHVLFLCERVSDALGHFQAAQELAPTALAIGKSGPPRKGTRWRFEKTSDGSTRRWTLGELERLSTKRAEAVLDQYDTYCMTKHGYCPTLVGRRELTNLVDTPVLVPPKALSQVEQRRLDAHQASLDPGADFSPYRAVVATSNLAGRGLDHPRFDAVLVEYLNTRNVNWWQQALGRAARFHPDKTSAEAVVLVDEEPDMLETYSIVRSWCVDQGFAVEDWAP